MLKTFQYRLYPTKAQETKMNATLDECRWLYNHLLEERASIAGELHRMQATASVR